MLYQVKEPEIWATVAAVSTYEVSTLGRVRHKGSGRVVNARASGGRYAHFGYQTPSGVRTMRIHRAVVETFLGPPPFNRAHTRHLDGNPINNKLSNLIWGTASENNADRKQHGTHDGGVNNSRAKLTEEQVRQIRAAPKTRGMPGKLAKQYGVKLSTIWNVLRGDRYKDIT